jgi:hypothetical protein
MHARKGRVCNASCARLVLLNRRVRGCGACWRVPLGAAPEPRRLAFRPGSASPPVHLFLAPHMPLWPTWPTSVFAGFALPHPAPRPLPSSAPPPPLPRPPTLPVQHAAPAQEQFEPGVTRLTPGGPQPVEQGYEADQPLGANGRGGEGQKERRAKRGGAPPARGTHRLLTSVGGGAFDVSMSGGSAPAAADAALAPATLFDPPELFTAPSPPSEHRRLGASASVSSVPTSAVLQSVVELSRSASAAVLGADDLTGGVPEGFRGSAGHQSAAANAAAAAAASFEVRACALGRRGGYAERRAVRVWVPSVPIPPPPPPPRRALLAPSRRTC